MGGDYLATYVDDHDGVCVLAEDDDCVDWPVRDAVGDVECEAARVDDDVTAAVPARVRREGCRLQ